MENRHNNTEIKCDMELSIEWLWIRTVWNLLAIIIDVMMLYLLFKTPNLLCGCFDKLYMCTFVADFFANVARVILKYIPMLLCDFDVVHRLERHIPLASVINGVEWYLSYVMICSAFFFNIDHAILVVFPKDYVWMCNVAVKWTLVTFCWLVPIVWILPMFDDCCKSTFLEDSAQPVFENSDVEDIYDCIDMILETFFYVPTIFACNCLSLSVLHFRYLESKNRKDVEYLKQLKKDNGKHNIWKTAAKWKYSVNPLPGVKELKEEWCNVGDKSSQYIAICIKERRKTTLLVHQRIIAEFNMSLVTLFDQIIDAVGVLFYLIFWGASNDWINLNESTALFMYDVCWELGTTTQPYLIMIICPQVRVAFYRLYLAAFINFKNKVSTTCSSATILCSFTDSPYLSS